MVSIEFLENLFKRYIHRYYISTIYELDTIAFDPVSCFDYQWKANFIYIGIANTNFVITPQVRKLAAAF